MATSIFENEIESKECYQVESVLDDISYTHGATVENVDLPEDPSSVCFDSVEKLWL